MSELITNAHLHAGSTANLVLVWDNRCLHVSVHDSSSAMPEPRTPDATTPNGRGLGLVEALADTWQTRPQSDGKTITACFYPPDQPDPHAGEADGTPSPGSR
ncbi:ATP-binding protein [Streptomyces tateyamensis]|uniref:ATP-binding protein n=1 Tax=Streptomyces tateyamensis TaxID=565073 RepID=UPI003CCC72AB